MTCTPDNPGNAPFEGKFASGNNSIPGCKNNPACSGIKGVGPIPSGVWQWTDEGSRPDRRNLVPLSEEAKTAHRSSIQSHHCKNPFGPAKGPKFCSEGCVTSTPGVIEKLNELIDSEPGSILNVIE